VNRENGLFLAVGILAGFLAGYVVHEEMAIRQPSRLAPGAATSTQQQEDPHAGGGARAAEIERLRRQIEANPEDAEAIRSLANLNFDIQSWARSRELYERYLTLRPGDADVMTDLGVCLRELGEFPGALERFREARKLAPQHWQSRFNEVVVLAFDLRDFTAAEQVLAELQMLQPENPDVARLAAEVAKQRNEA